MLANENQLAPLRVCLMSFRIFLATLNITTMGLPKNNTYNQNLNSDIYYNLYLNTVPTTII